MGTTHHIGDKVAFDIGVDTLDYRVRGIYLQCVSGSNDKIFDSLGLDKNAFCSKAYGYECGGGLFPEYRQGDLQAVDRVIEALHEECRKFNEGKTELYVDMYVPLAAPPGAVYLEVIEDIRRSDIEVAGTMPDVIKAGAITWHDEDKWEHGGHRNCYLEGNRWGANIPKKYFKVIEQRAPTEQDQTALKVDMEAIRAECMKRYPIGCIYIHPGTAMDAVVLRSDAITYKIAGNSIYAHGGGGCLYLSGEWATIIPQESDSNGTLAHNGDDTSCQVMIQTQPESIGANSHGVEKVTGPACTAPIRMRRLTPSFMIN